MTNSVLELIAIKLHQKEVPEILLNTLSLILNSDSVFHSKNHLKAWDKNKYIQCFEGIENCYTKDFNKYGWLLNFINNVRKI